MIKQEDIIKPLIFLDIFDYPPTAIELWRFLGVKAGLGEVMDICHSRAGGNPVLSSRTLDPRLRGDDNGFYFLSGREELIEKRREFFQLSEKKFKIAKRAAWLLHFIPSIKMIAICNNFYYRPQSDIDFFIITAANRLWLTRFFATIILDIFGLRARGKKRADKICLSFYLSEENMSLESVVLKPAKYCGPTETDDPYLSYWLAFLEPIYGQECYNKFWEANAWLKNIFPNIEAKRPVSRRQVGGIKSREYTLPVAEAAPPLPRRGLSAYFGDWLEKLAKKIQWWKISVHVKEMAVFNDSRVVINDAMLKFHENDRREFYREKCINELNNF